jgi:hypothetical protein
MWTVEKSLQLIKQNASKLSDNYLNSYENSRNLLIYINAPLVILSALNSYAIYEMDSFGPAIQYASASTSLLIALLLSGEMCIGIRTNVEETLRKSKEFKDLKERVNDILSLEKGQEISQEFAEKTIKEYKELVKSDKFIDKYQGNLSAFASETVDDMKTLLEDHWNILYRPAFKTIQDKNNQFLKYANVNDLMSIFQEKSEKENVEEKDLEENVEEGEKDEKGEKDEEKVKYSLVNTLKYVQSFVPSFPVFTKTSESSEQTDVSDSESPDVENPEDEHLKVPLEETKIEGKLEEIQLTNIYPEENGKSTVQENPVSPKAPAPAPIKIQGVPHPKSPPASKKMSMNMK